MKKICTFFIVVSFALNGINISAQVNYYPSNPSVIPGNCSSQIGYQTMATGNHSFASGYLSIASGNNSISIGTANEATGPFSMCLGQQNKAQSQSFAIGQSAFANGDQSLAIGRFVETATNTMGNIVLGNSSSIGSLINNVSNSLMIGFNSSVPTLFVGPSPTYSAFGKVGIGTTEPATTLDINGDVTVRTLSNTDETSVVTTDKTGKLQLSPVSNIIQGDNLGNHVATQNITIGQWVISENACTKESLVTRPDGSTFCPGLHYTPNYHPNSMALETGGSPRFYVIGADGESSSIWAGNWADGGYGLLNVGDGTGGIFRASSGKPTPLLGIRNGKVGIGMIPTTAESSSRFSLFVPGGVLTEEVLIKIRESETSWPDYVFNKEYSLMPLKELDSFIQQNKHLPEAPSATDVAENGISVSEMNALLLKKIEELTLYVIELKKEIETLKK